jgi:hypothetical protein
MPTCCSIGHALARLVELKAGVGSTEQLSAFMFDRAKHPAFQHVISRHQYARGCKGKILLFQGVARFLAALRAAWHGACCMSDRAPQKLTNRPNQPLGELKMKSTLTVKDLAANKELDREEMSAVRGGFGDQAIAEQLGNAQIGGVSMNVGNESKFSGPTTIQSDSKFDQHATNDSYSKNFKSFFGDLPL